MILCVLGVGLAVAALWPLLSERRQRVAPAVVAIAAAVAVMVRFGTPSLAKVHASLDERYGQCTADLIDAKCTHILGFYWQVWPSVLHAMITFHDRGEPRTLWGVGHRAIPTKAEWQAMPLADATLCSGRDTVEHAQAAAQFFGLPAVRVGSEHGTIVVLDFDRTTQRGWRP